ncbi:hypothetical protein EPK99_09210 [Neorhizobium lilium]|uniref:Uncharacterized protein n=1 Tax=Neorhizobium lilium TaxID=2503024 RepID=A0A444LIL3_9HYPH|nr:hypothetical protein [Neorhizobium lilium]RWX78757.1 hypothetical protein EPK99_09210 [Neorhizobium lilium]
MTNNNMSNLLLSDLLELEQERMWIIALAQIYGVDDVLLALDYAEKSKMMKLDIADQILRVLNLLPISAVSTSAGVPIRLTKDIRNSLANIMDPSSLEAVSDALIKAVDVAGDPKKFQFEFWGGVRDMRRMGNQYMNMKNDKAPANAVRAAMLDKSYLVAARGENAELFLGPDVSFYGIADGNGYYRFSSGWMFFGPGIDLDAGSYLVEIEIRCLNPTDRLILDVTTDVGLNKLLEIKTVGDVVVALAFDVSSHHGKIEVRCVNPSDNDVICDIRRVAFGRQNVLTPCVGEVEIGPLFSPTRIE